MNHAIKVRGLKKSYGGKIAVNGIDLEVVQGEIFAILGPNGAGKTTTVEILEGYRDRDSGDVAVLELDDPALVAGERAFPDETARRRVASRLLRETLC